MVFDESFLRKLEALRLAVRRSISGRRAGERLSKRRGGSSDFTSHRSYTQGDEFRAIDWNIYGRLGLLYIKEFTREEALTVRLAIDTSTSMAPKFEFAQRLGAALALVANQEAPSMPLPEIENLKVGTPFSVPTVPRGLAIVVSDLWDDGLRQQLMKMRTETAVIHVLSPEELDPPLAGKMRLVDSETGESVVRFVGEEERAAYREMNYLRCSSSTPLEDVVQVYLREAGVLE
jgi:hypothetical protein